MAPGFSRRATQHLTRARLELLPRRAARRWLMRSALLLGALGAGAGVGYLGREPAVAVVRPAPVNSLPEVRQARQQLDQASLALRLASARSEELERQVDTLNQRLRESTEELAFFRKAREARHP